VTGLKARERGSRAGTEEVSGPSGHTDDGRRNLTPCDVGEVTAGARPGPAFAVTPGCTTLRGLWPAWLLAAIEAMSRHACGRIIMRPGNARNSALCG
jgi:hypothetical protein